MKPTLSWTTIDRDALARAARLVADRGTGTVDEIGVLALHRQFADAFFPGTSVLHTRLRYALFIPWIYGDLLTTGAPRPLHAVEDRELLLATRLVAGTGGADVIGGTLVGEGRTPVQLASASYWSALGTWGVLRRDRWNRPFRRRALLRRMRRRTRLTETDADTRRVVAPDAPFIALPDPPSEFLAADLDFALTHAEAVFLQDRFLSTGGARPSLLAHLAQRGDVTADLGFGVLEVDGFEGVLSLARRTARLAGVARAAYAALVERALQRDGIVGSTKHRDHLEAVLDTWGQVARSVDLSELNAGAGLHPLLLATQHLRGVRRLDDIETAFTIRERKLKGSARARLGSTPVARQRRSEWDPGKTALATPLHYRWPWVRRLLCDLRDGLAQ